MDALIIPDETMEIRAREELMNRFGVVGIAPTQSVIRL